MFIIYKMMSFMYSQITMNYYAVICIYNIYSVAIMIKHLVTSIFTLHNCIQPFLLKQNEDHFKSYANLKLIALFLTKHTGLFHQAILMSGNELSVWVLQPPEEQPSNYLKQVGYQIYVASFMSYLNKRHISIHKMDSFIHGRSTQRNNKCV